MVVVTTRGGGWIARVKAADALCEVDAESVAWMEKLAMPAVVGVPLIMPLDKRVSPAGRAPEVIV